MKKRKLIIGGNWKMYKTPSEAIHVAKALKVKLINVANVDVVICPPFPALVPVNEILKESNIKIGGQNLYWQDEGAFSGEVSAKMLLDAGCRYVVIGHSERRHVFGEKNNEINQKVKKALKNSLIPMFCVGETLEEGALDALVRGGEPVDRSRALGDARLGFGDESREFGGR